MDIFQVPAEQIQTYHICWQTAFTIVCTPNSYSNKFICNIFFYRTNGLSFASALTFRFWKDSGLFFKKKMREIYLKVFVWMFGNMTSDGSLLYSQDKPTSCLLSLNFIGEMKKNGPERSHVIELQWNYFYPNDMPRVMLCLWIDITFVVLHLLRNAGEHEH